jgi:hypothetical protein
MSHEIKLINEMIDGTIHQKHLIAYKKTHSSNQSEDDMGHVGRKYWYKFLDRHKHRIVSKRKTVQIRLFKVD